MLSDVLEVLRRLKIHYDIIKRFSSLTVIYVYTNINMSQHNAMNSIKKESWEDDCVWRSFSDYTACARGLFLPITPSRERRRCCLQRNCLIQRMTYLVYSVTSYQLGTTDDRPRWQTPKPRLSSSGTPYGFHVACVRLYRKKK